MRVYGKDSLRVRVKRLIKDEVLAECCMILETPAVFFVHTNIDSALNVILYSLVIWLGDIVL